MTTAEAATILDLSPTHVRRLRAKGQLEAQKIGRDWCYSPESVAAYGAVDHAVGRPITNNSHRAAYMRRYAAERRRRRKK